jgi:hypothetical protein
LRNNIHSRYLYNRRKNILYYPAKGGWGRLAYGKINGLIESIVRHGRDRLHALDASIGISIETSGDYKSTGKPGKNSKSNY